MNREERRAAERQKGQGTDKPTIFIADDDSEWEKHGTIMVDCAGSTMGPTSFHFRDGHPDDYDPVESPRRMADRIAEFLQGSDQWFEIEEAPHDGLPFQISRYALERVLLVSTAKSKGKRAPRSDVARLIPASGPIPRMD